MVIKSDKDGTSIISPKSTCLSCNLVTCLNLPLHFMCVFVDVTSDRLEHKFQALKYYVSLEKHSTLVSRYGLIV